MPDRDGKKYRNALKGFPKTFRQAALNTVGKAIGRQVSLEDVEAGLVEPPEPVRMPRDVDALCQRYYGDRRFTDWDEDGAERFDFAGAWRHAERLWTGRIEAGRRHRANKDAAEQARRLLRPLMDAHDPHALSLMSACEDDIREEGERRAEFAKGVLGKRATARDRCPKHHRRRVRAEIAVASHHAASLLGLIGKHRPFASGDGLRRHKERQTRGADWIDASAIKSTSDGRVIPLRDVVDAHREARRSSMYALTLGLQAESDRLGYDAAFITLTLPGRFHPNAKTYDPTLTPTQVRDELSHRWKAVRDLANHSGVRYFGLWVKEPHRDGCPHMHLLVFVHPDDRARLIDCARRHFPEPEGYEDKPDSERVACNAKAFDAEGAAKSAAVYIMYYIQKLQAGEPDSPDIEPIEVKEDHLREKDAYDAWASDTRTRKYGFIGLRRGLLTDWRTIYQASDLPDDPDLRAVKSAMHRAGAAAGNGDDSSAEWATALRALDAFARLPDGAGWGKTYEERTNSYGETERRPLAVVAPSGTALPVKAEEWEIVDLSDDFSLSDSVPRGAPPPPAEPPPTPDQWMRATFGIGLMMDADAPQNAEAASA